MQTISASTGGLLREKHVLKLIPVAHSTLWSWVQDKKFPAPVKLSEKVSVWQKDAILSWIEDRFSEGEHHDASPEPVGQLGHDGDPTIETGRKKRGVENG